MPPKRRSYTAGYKLQVVKYAAENGNRAAERKFGVSEKLVRDWRKAGFSYCHEKKTKKAYRGLKARWPELEKQAHSHGLHRFFSCRGIALAVETFWRRGHREITVFVPQWRQKRDRLTTEQHFLNQLEDLRLLSFTPSREVCGQRISSHDDRFLLHLAEKTDGVIVTNDNLRDFVNTSDTWRKIIQERLLQFTFVEDHFMIPDDPLGRKGPHLDMFLRKNNRKVPVTPPPLRPPDFRPSSQQQQPVYVQALHSAPWTPDSTPQPPPSLMTHPTAHWPHSGPPEWHPPRRSPSPSPSPPPQRSPGETSELKQKLYDIFPDQKQRIDRILSDNPYMRDLNALSGLLLG